MPDAARWEIFCKVVDNYGDAGVCWRLARQLATEHALQVTLWLDDLDALARIAKDVVPERAAQEIAGVTLRRWTDPLADAAPAAVVVEAFGCGLPEECVAAMARMPVAPLWFILEYLSAEAWIDGAHGKASPHPRLPLARRFWFPGFTPQTGGILHERGLAAVRAAYQRDPAAQQALWARLQIPAAMPDEIRVSLFCYPNPALPALLDAWADGDGPVSCVVPAGVAAGALDFWTGGNVPHPGHPYRRGSLSVYAIPFLEQDEYDRLLWLCAVNFVRGEDSFVRAQWAARPFVWHIYPQTEGAHWRKQDAFLERWVPGLAPGPATALRLLWRTWNAVPGLEGIGPAWQKFLEARAAIEQHAVAWAEQLGSLPDLATGMVAAASARV
jgi:uncharacterized repeat protein (TIGR03837 family)